MSKGNIMNWSKYLVRFTPALSALLFFAISSGTAFSAVDSPTYAERLGWPEGTKAVIFHVDDAGRSHGTNLGTIKALEEGVGTSTSIMMPRSGAEEFVAYVKAHPAVDAGLHLDLARGAAADDAEKEIRAQIDKALSMGITPTHLDGEGAMQFNTEYTDRFVKVAMEKKIPLLFYGGHMQYISAEAGSNKDLFLSISKKLWDSGLPVIDDILAQRSHSEVYEERKTNLIELLREMKPGITEVIFHCSVKTDDEGINEASAGPGPMAMEGNAPSGGPGPMGAGATPSGAPGGPMAAGAMPSGAPGGMGDMSLEGEMDVRLLTDPDIKAFIQSEGIVLTTWRELMERRGQAGI